MDVKFELSPDLKKRVEIIAAQSNLSPAQIISDALEYGHSLEWQERFHQQVKQVKRGIAAAERGDFASEGDIARLGGKYRAL
ncbi:transcriptional regulator [Rhizobium sp. FY34]|uniref:transcriptional regulator n=1 Tax=Rhizobium sp. FY34 TaxID=2562309 RepID=UPI0010C0A27D|nr:transcriptional regulator [Rhizobium sp. FY34]